MSAGERQVRAAWLWARDVITRPYALEEHIQVFTDAVVSRRHRMNLPARYATAGRVSEISYGSNPTENQVWGRAAAAILHGDSTRVPTALLGANRPTGYPHIFDGDPGFLSLIRAVLERRRPKVVVETGVANGASSALILSSLTTFGTGRLYSIDACEAERMGGRTGQYVDETLRGRWELVAGTSRERLEPLLRRVGPVDFFIHDSLHTFRNMMFELNTAIRYAREGGCIFLADDIEKHTAFPEFVGRAGLSWEIYSHEAKSGLFGIAYSPTTDPRGETL